MITTTITATEYIYRDVCVYGGSPAALTAALQVKAQGKSVALIVPGQHVGGMLVEGLGSQDVDNNGTQNSLVISGLALEFYERVGAEYGYPAMYRFESSKAEAAIDQWLDEAEIDVYRGNRLAESYEAVVKDDAKIIELQMENGNRFRADMFIDGTIEGDLMKWAGVSYIVGREGNDVYDETLNGVRESSYRQFKVNVDPYIVPGDPSSGLIATVQDEPKGEPGSGDDSIMGFCFRQCLTKNDDNKIPINKPDNYDPANYEIYRRYFAAGGSIYMPAARLPNGKTDLGSWHALSGNLYGYNHGWPDGTYAEREAIYQYHKDFIQGLYWFLSNDPAVPSSVRDEWSQWGLAADEFTDNGGWPRSLYIRSGRRMISDYVLTEAHTKGAVVAEDSIGVAWWPPDAHHARRIVEDGVVRNEGFFFEQNYTPFPISYRSLVPKRSECTNLLVPAALSSSYVAYGSVRLEWTQMVCGQSAGAGAVEALRAGVDVQDVEYNKLRPALLSGGLVLDVPGEDAPVEGEIVVDNRDPEFSSQGAWVSSTFFDGYIGTDYLHDNQANKGQLSATFTPQIENPGAYQVYVRWTADDKRDTAVPITIVHANGQTNLTVNQQDNGNQWRHLGDFVFEAGNSGYIKISNANTSGYVIVDAVRLAPTDHAPQAELTVTPNVSETREGSNNPAEFTIVREGAQGLSLSINYSISGSASSGGDYDTSSNQLQLLPDQSTVKLQINSLLDSIPEGKESVTLTLEPGEGYVLGAENSATIHIVDSPDQAFQHLFFTPSERAAGLINAWDADPDNDGIPNMFEFLGGANPRESTPQNWPEIHFNGASQVEVIYKQAHQAMDMEVSLQRSMSLQPGSWEILNATANAIGWDDHGNYLMCYTVSALPSQFFRLHVAPE